MELVKDLSMKGGMTLESDTLDFQVKEENYELEVNIYESILNETMPTVLSILLIDRTTSTVRKTKNIIWANDRYVDRDSMRFNPTQEISIESITGRYEGIIMPRALKTKEEQKQRTKSKAEVFTPLWIVKLQNDAIDENYTEDDIDTYINRKWLEITCGEAPYMATRYDMESGEPIELDKREGFLDRKLRRINKEIDDKALWQHYVEQAYKSSYGFEWNGDSLLLARENLLYTYCDFFRSKWKGEPSLHLLESIVTIISYNVFQMDGLKYIIPLSEKKIKEEQYELSLFGDETPEVKWKVIPGKRVKIMNWKTNRMVYFDKF